MKGNSKKDQMLRLINIIVFVTAIAELALSQLSIRIIRLSAEELTGISYFAFIILGLITLFAVSRMKESLVSGFFAAFMCFASLFAAFMFFKLLFADDIFFRNLYYSLNRQTQNYELLPLGGRISSSIPMIVVALGALVYSVSGIVILIVSLTSIGKKTN